MKISGVTLFAALGLVICIATPVLGSEASLEVRDICSDVSCDSETTVFEVDRDGGFVSYGTLGIGTIPASGPGVRTMWYPFRGAFRTGNPGDDPGTDAWDDVNMGFYSFAGGYATQARAYGSFAFGDQVIVSGVDATGFGGSNIVSGTAGFSAGASNACTGFACTAIGYRLGARGQGAVALGYRSVVGTNYGVAIGHRATTCTGTSIANGDIVDQACPSGARTGSMVFSDASTTNYVGSTANNQFVVRAAGGYRLYTNSSVSTGVSLSAGGGSWSSLSDRNAKQDFAPVDPESVLTRLTRLPVTSWRYADEDPSVRHVGPMAQDWQELVAGPLGLNADDRYINQGDFDGVNLLGIIALETRTRRLAEDNQALRVQLAELQKAGATEQAQRKVDAERLERLEARLELLATQLSAEPLSVSTGPAFSP